eukprot:m.231225 g.231225  ORF g.231225 m.231225 type:complete len:71 (+) comp15687_c0_seq9:2221-2433(+)
MRVDGDNWSLISLFHTNTAKRHCHQIATLFEAARLSLGTLVTSEPCHLTTGLSLGFCFTQFVHHGAEGRS